VREGWIARVDADAGVRDMFYRQLFRRARGVFQRTKTPESRGRIRIWKEEFGLSRKFLKLAALAVVLTLMGVTCANAAITEKKWVGGTDEFWSTGDNWSEKGVPYGTEHSVTIEKDASITLKSAVASMDRLEVKYGDVAFTLSGDTVFEVSGDVIVDNKKLEFVSVPLTQAAIDSGTKRPVVSLDGKPNDSGVVEKTVINVVGNAGELLLNVPVFATSIDKTGAGSLTFGEAVKWTSTGSKLTIKQGEVKIGTKDQLTDVTIVLSADAAASADEKTFPKLTLVANTQASVLVDEGGVSTDAKRMLILNTEEDVDFFDATVKGTKGDYTLTKTGTKTLRLGQETWDAVDLTVAEGTVSPYQGATDIFKIYTDSTAPDIIVKKGATLIVLSEDVGAISGDGTIQFSEHLRLSGGGWSQSAFGGTLAGKGKLTLTGPVELKGTNSYTGQTNLGAQAKLILHNTIASSKISFDEGAELTLMGGVKVKSPIDVGAESVINVGYLKTEYGSYLDDTIAELAGTVTFLEGEILQKKGEGTLVLSGRVLGDTESDVLSIDAGAVSVKNATALDRLFVEISRDAVLIAGAEEDLLVNSGGVLSFDGQATLGVTLKASNRTTPVVSFTDKVTNSLKLSGSSLKVLIMGVADPDGASGDSYAVLDVKGMDLEKKNVSVQLYRDEQGIVPFTAKVDDDADGGKLWVTLLKNVDHFTFGTLDTPSAEAGKAYTGTVPVTTQSNSFHVRKAEGPSWLKVTPAPTGNAILLSGTVPASEEGKTIPVKVSVTTNGSAAVMANTKEWSGSFTVSGKASEEPEAEEVAPEVALDTLVSGELHEQDPSFAKADEPVTVSFKLKVAGATDVKVYVDSATSDTFAVGPKAYLADFNAGAPDTDGIYKVTFPYSATYKSWGVLYKVGDVTYKTTPPFDFKVTDVPTISVVATSTSTTIAVEFAYLDDVDGTPVSGKKIKLSLYKGTELVNELDVDPTTDKVESHTFSGLTPDTAYRVVGEDPDGVAATGEDEISTKSSGSGGGGGGGGCDAGFAGLSLLLAAPLFLRKKSK
jgi:Synergist-CTERM protein sorting domain-containing protein